LDVPRDSPPNDHNHDHDHDHDHDHVKGELGSAPRFAGANLVGTARVGVLRTPTRTEPTA